MIQVKGVVEYKQGRQVLKGLSCEFRQGRMYGIIGPNGAGKSTLLQLLSGVEKPMQGDIQLEGRRIWTYPRKQLARKMAVLQQGGLPPAGFTVRQVVSMGRFPYQGWLGTEDSEAEAIMAAAIEKMELGELQERKLEQLSGGERQRVALAKLMAQQPSILLLDEPTTYLDIGFQVQLLDTVRAWQREQGLTVIAVLHDLNLAALYCEELLVLHQGRIAAAGTPAEVLNEKLIADVYGTTTAIIPHPITGAPQIMLKPNDMASISDSHSKLKGN